MLDSLQTFTRKMFVMKNSPKGNTPTSQIDSSLFSNELQDRARSHDGSIILSFDYVKVLAFEYCLTFRLGLELYTVKDKTCLQG